MILRGDGYAVAEAEDIALVGEAIKAVIARDSAVTQRALSDLCVGIVGNASQGGTPA